ncbi:hypothetical protein HPB50_016284 [Hyalomma asiaticum]|uniref:Uncharacterized protein n=1 Tax=Hyalomma asiaticum TaxID=266040 RepID=A0ACB7TAH1_HYAAI|nr:hypothetical protein HPB50_016284 [Hyalomma asiaticum]
MSQVSHVPALTQRSIAWTAPIVANPSRARNNRPFCFACRSVGHVARYCHRLAPVYTDARSQYNYMDRPRPRYESPDPQSNTSSRDYPQSGRYVALVGLLSRARWKPRRQRRARFFAAFWACCEPHERSRRRPLEQFAAGLERASRRK